ncbi:MAG: DUF3500 domain-containing protein [Microbacteriaceae bacterium]
MRTRQQALYPAGASAASPWRVLFAVAAAFALVFGSVPAAAVASQAFSVTHTPKISGTVAVGKTVTAKVGSWSGSPKFSYRWYANGTRIKGATSKKLTIQAAQLGKHLTVKVTAKRSGYTTVVKKSAKTTRVKHGTLTAHAVSISGTAAVGSTLSAVVGRWSPSPKFYYRWYADGVRIAGANAQTYTVTSAELGKTIRVKVIAKRSGYTRATKWSTSTAAVVTGSSASDSGASTGTTALSAGTVTIAWTPPASSDETGTLSAITAGWDTDATLSFLWSTGATTTTISVPNADADYTLTVTASLSGYTSASATASLSTTTVTFDDTDDDDSSDDDSSTSSGTVAEVVTAANEFISGLSTSQASSAVLSLTSANAVQWSNLPCGSQCRVGVEFTSLSDDQVTEAEALLKLALGSGTGYDQVIQILAADDVLDAAASTSSASSTYESDYYYLAFLGTPSTTGAWELHFGGHHLAVNISYDAGEVTGASPFFIGVEPTSWTDDCSTVVAYDTSYTATNNDCTDGSGTTGTTYAPLNEQYTAIYDMINSLSTSELSTAKLSQSYSDVLLGPGADGEFPETKSGIQVSQLTDTQKALVLDAIAAWVDVAADDTATELLAEYEADLDDTYVSYSGNTSLTSQGDYVRIDGPGVWIEFVCQNGVVFSSNIHYHTIYRDHEKDYGGEFDF